ncbi:MAG: glycosyltransferase family 4 protein [Lautropia sp.]
MKILLEMRPAFDGHAGIPQEARLLFRGLSKIDGCTVDGLIQSSTRMLSKGLPAHPKPLLPGRVDPSMPEHRKLDRLSRVVVSLQHNPARTPIQRLRKSVQTALEPARVAAGTVMGRQVPLGRFEGTHFKDFVWRSMFAKTLPSQDFDLVTSAGYRVARMSWSGMHSMGLATRRFGRAVYPTLDTTDFDVMIAETPYPGRVAPNTQMVVRYHDAIPLLMPHTIADRSYHQSSHYQALDRNVRDGAWFACVSDATRRDLVAIFPQAESRSVTIHNMVSHHYFPEATSPARVPEILRTRRNTNLEAELGAGSKRQVALPRRAGDAPPYLLMVSTIEPRKNHLSLLSAWESLRTSLDPDLQLVLVGSIGWESDPIMRRLKPWLRRGGVHLLEDVPAQELRLLYRHARCVVCPSYYEGFDFSGVEAMRCGGVVLASDIQVHRDVYGDASEYFNPYSVDELEQSLARLLSPEAAPRRAALVEAGARTSLQYTPERILPQWHAFLDDRVRARRDGAR